MTVRNLCEEIFDGTCGEMSFESTVLTGLEAAVKAQTQPPDSQSLNLILSAANKLSVQEKQQKLRITRRGSAASKVGERQQKYGQYRSNRGLRR